MLFCIVCLPTQPSVNSVWLHHGYCEQESRQLHKPQASFLWVCPQSALYLSKRFYLSLSRFANSYIYLVEVYL